MIALRTDGICARSSDSFETLLLVMSQCHVLRRRGGRLVEVERKLVIAIDIDK